jgi:hypothetical protein
MNAMAHDLIDPKSDKRAKSLLLPLHSEEKVLLNKNGSLATSILIPVNTSYERVRDTFKAILTGRMGIFMMEEVISAEYSKKPDSGDKEVDSIIWKRRNQLKASGINIGIIRQFLIRTNQYNLLRDIKGYSLLNIKIIDGKDIFNKECVLILMRRTDYWRDWGREYHTGIPIPIKGPMEIDCITDTELKMVEELKNKLGIKKMRHFIPETPYSPLLDVDMMKAIKEEVKNFNSSPKRMGDY